MLKNISDEGLEKLIAKSVEIARKSFADLQHLSTVEQFSWSFIAACCNHVTLTAKELHKFGSYSFAIKQFCELYSGFNRSKSKKSSSQFFGDIPDVIKNTSNDDITIYFKWICKIQSIFIEWNHKFKNKEYNFDDTLQYINSLNFIDTIAKLLDVSKYSYELEKIEEFKDQFLCTYNELCSFLIKESKDNDK